MVGYIDYLGNFSPKQQSLSIPRPKKILVIRPGGMGDFLLLLPSPQDVRDVVGRLGLYLGLRRGQRGNRTTSLLASTLAAAAVVASVQIIETPPGGMPEYMFRHRVFHSAQVSHVLMTLAVLYVAADVWRRRRWRGGVVGLLVHRRDRRWWWRGRRRRRGSQVLPPPDQLTVQLLAA